MKNIAKQLVVALVCSLMTLVPSSADAASSDCTISSGTKCTVTFSYTGISETFIVPAGVTSVYFDVRGAKGGGTNAGLGGIDTGTLIVSSGVNLILKVGGQGVLGLAANGGYNGGGNTSAGDTAPGSGGGASDIRVNLDTLASRVVVAGGGGGQSTYCASTNGKGGDGGGLVGGDGGGGSGCWASTEYGRGGTQTSGGVKGTYGGFTNTAGSLGKGGNGNGNSAGGGGGGGGYYGGGGGLVEAGGGGSSYVDTNTAHQAYVTSFALIRGGNNGNGVISLTYTMPLPTSASISISSALTYREINVLTVTSDAPGTATFFVNGKKAPGCIRLALTGSAPNYTAPCSFKPSARGVVSLTAQIIPSDSHLPGTSGPLLAQVANRRSRR
jgi:hypothetical protein